MVKIRSALDNLSEYTPGKNPENEKVIKLASNENALGPSPKAVAEIKKQLKNLSIYPDKNSGLLTRALAEKYSISENNIIIGNGSDEIMQLLAAAYLSAGDEVLIAKNTFSVYEFVARLFDGDLIFVDLKNYAYDLPAFAEKSSEKTKLIFLCNPNNPTGTIFSAAELDSFLANIPDQYIVVVDEAYADYTESDIFPDALKYVREGENVIVLRTFSKIFGLAGLRCGYGIAKEEIIKYLRMVKLPFNVNRLAVNAAVAALEDKEHIEKSLENNKKGKEYLYEELKKLKDKVYFLETESNFICIKVNQPADQVFLKLMSEGVIVRPLTSFGMPEHLRVTIGTPAQNKKFIKAFRSALEAAR
ncbi:histidinol-phosphate transaminase [Candidatus Margulisiibacteriota bacterium]